MIVDRLAGLADSIKRRNKRLMEYEAAKAEVEKEIYRLLV
jgi:hypothetical protein